MNEARNLSRDARLLACLLLAILGLAPQIGSAQSEPAASAPPPPGRLIDLGGYKLHLNCTGQGKPTVVLSAGAGDASFAWALVQPEAAKLTRVCSYDRSGTAWSDLGPKPRTVYQEAYDLHRLLAKAGEHGPYVLVGHSAGGTVARIFAMQYRKETRGVVLVDAGHENGQYNINGKWVRLRTLATVSPRPTLPRRRRSRRSRRS
jgi:pimeloyl-ACP methyl ester carboxylesterase